MRPGVRVGKLILQAEVGPTFPLLRRNFVFRTGPAEQAEVHEVPWVSWQLGAGAGVEL